MRPTVTLVEEVALVVIMVVNGVPSYPRYSMHNTKGFWW
jgi:hypothetical protein